MKQCMSPRLICTDVCQLIVTFATQPACFIPFIDRITFYLWLQQHLYEATVPAITSEKRVAGYGSGKVCNYVHAMELMPTLQCADQQRGHHRLVVVLL